MRRIGKKDPPSSTAAVPPSFGDYQPGIFEPANRANTQPSTSLPIPVSASATPASLPSKPPSQTAKKDIKPSGSNDAPLFLDAESSFPPQASATQVSVAAPSAPAKTAAAKLPPTAHGKYVQGKKIQTIDDVTKKPPPPPRRQSAIVGVSPIGPQSRTPLNPGTDRSPNVGGITPPGPSGMGGMSPVSASYAPGAPLVGLHQPPTQPRNFRAPPTGPAQMTLQPPVANMPSPLHPQGLAGNMTSMAPAYNVSADPRRRAAKGTSPLIPSLPSPISVTGSAQGSATPIQPASGPPRAQRPTKRVEFNSPLDITVCLPLRDPVDLAQIELHMLPGAAKQKAEPILVQRLLAREKKDAAERQQIVFEEVGPVAITGSIRLNATVVEWARAAHVNRREARSKDSYELLKQLLSAGKVSSTLSVAFFPGPMLC